VLAETLHNLSSNVSHIIVRINYIQEQIREGNIMLKYIDTNNQVADILTKPLQPEPFIRHRKHMLTGYGGEDIKVIPDKRQKTDRIWYEKLYESFPPLQ